MSDDNPTDWDAKVRWMRANHVVRAEWSKTLDYNVLASAELGPLPAEHDDITTQQSFTADEQERRTRDARRELSMRSSGGPVKPVGGS